MYCKNCGNKIEDSEKFCGKCGTKIDDLSNNRTIVEDLSNKRTIMDEHSEKNLNKNKSKKILIGTCIAVLLLIGMISIKSDDMFNVCCFAFFIADIVYIITQLKSSKKNVIDDILVTDMELNIAQLEINPSNNKRIKITAEYMENNIMPNETILAAAPTSDMLSGVVAVLTDKRLIYIGVINRSFVRVYPLEKINSVVQNGQYIYINEQYIVISDINLATKFASLINNTISSTQNIGDVIKIENKIVTEENIATQLKKLSDLHKANVLTDYEYSIKKQELLDKMK